MMEVKASRVVSECFLDGIKAIERCSETVESSPKI